MYTFEKNVKMKPEVKRYIPENEYETPEQCFITETANDSDDEHVSISRARVKPGVTTAWHILTNTSERYIIISGKGSVELDYDDPINVAEGDVVRIPPGIPQRITNIGKDDLIFYCICSPRFQDKNYVSLE